MLLLTWMLVVTPLDPVANQIIPQQKPSFATEELCNSAQEAFIRAHMYTNWQGLKMAPLVRTSCLKNDGG